MIAFCCTFFQVFNIPVFWPILVMYFITLFCITMKRQIKVVTIFETNLMLFFKINLRVKDIPSDCFPLQHMIRFRYLPFTWGKPKFQVSWAQYFLLHPWPFPTDQQTNLTIFGQTKTMFCLSHSLLRESEEVGEGKAPLLQQSAWSQADDFSQGAADKLIWSWCQWSAHQLPVVETGQMW